METKYSKLIQCRNFREFLATALKIQYAKKGKVNLSHFSKISGFSSRSYLSEVLNGKKGLSRDTLVKIKRGIKLPRLYKKLFENLVFLEDKTLRPTRATKANIQSQIKNILQEISNESTIQKIPNKKNIVGKVETFRVFASLGSSAKGADLSTIKRRSKLDEKTVLKALSLLKNEGLIKNDDNRFYCINTKVDFLNLDTDQGIKDLTEEVCRDILCKADSLFADKKNISFFTSFSIARSDRDIAQKEIQEAIFDILDKYQADDGDDVQNLFFVYYNK